MDAASILLVLAAAGQAAWSPPNRYDAPPPAAAAPAADRYPLPLDGPGETAPLSRRMTSAPLQQITNPFAASSAPTGSSSRSRSSVTPPPWDAAAALEESWAAEPATSSAPVDPTRSPGMAPVRTENGWTTIGAAVAAPPLIIPQLVAAPATNASSPSRTASTAVQNTAPSGSSSAAASAPPREQAQSRPTQSSRQPPPPQNNAASAWANGWDDYRASQATIGRSETVAPLQSTVGASEMVPVQPVQAPPQTVQQTPQHSQSEPSQRSQPSSDWRDLWADENHWDQPPQSTSAGAGGSSAPAAANRHEVATTGGSNVVALGSHPVRPAEPRYDGTGSNVVSLGSGSAVQSAVTAAPASTATATTATVNDRPPSETVSQFGNVIATLPPAGQPVATAPVATGATAAGPAGDQPPWLPLLVVSLSLAGSLGANLFLGWSYLDARQKYRALVRKTADKFRRTSRAAA